MATQTNRVEWEFLLNQRQLDRGLKKTRGDFDKTKGKTDTLSKAMGGLTKAAGILGLAVGAGAILQFGKDAITAASDYDEAVNAIEVATGDAAEQIIEFGKTADDAIGLSETAVLEAGVAFSGFADAIAEDDQVADTFEDYITRAADFASVMNVDVSDAVRIFQSTLSGESEPIRRYGLDLSAAAVGAFAVAEGIVESASQMTASDKTLARYGLLMRETEKFAGDFANTSDGLANSTKTLTAKYENARKELGQELIPIQLAYNKALLEGVEILGGFVKGLSDNRSEAELLSRQMFEANKIQGDFNGTYDEWVDSLAKSEGKRKSLAGFWDFLIGRTPDLDEKLADLTKTQEGVDKAFADAADAADDFYSSAGDKDLVVAGFVLAASDAEQGVEDFKDEVKRLDDAMGDAKTRADIFAGAMFEVAKRAKEAAKEAAEAEKLFAGGGGSGQEAEPGSAPPVTNTGPDSGYARGGTLHRGETALVGEEGPEVITAGNALRVHPNGTGGGNVYITVNALDPMQAAEAVKNALDYWNATNG